MQTTLLGLAVAIIVALVAALVGPLFVDWGRWRAPFEAEATRIIGMPVHVSGHIDARLLPTPSLFLNGVEIGSGGEPKLRARTLDVRFALGSLLRGEWRAAQLHLEEPEFTVGVDAEGRIDVPQLAIGLDPDQLAFDGVEIDNGRAVLVDAASDRRLVLEDLSFRGNIRSLLGPFKGDGGFVSSGQPYGYRIAGGRAGDDGGMRLRLAVNPADRPLTVESDGTLWVERGRPRYEGTLTVSRPAGFALTNGKTVASEPWRAVSRIKASATGALLEQIDFQYGPEDRSIKLAGTAELKVGATPRLEGVLSARQIDLDRASLLADQPRRTPIAFLRGITDALAEFGQPPLAMRLGVGVDLVTLAGGSVIDLRGDIVAADGAWSIDDLEFRAPGATQVRASGRLALASGTAEFSGPASLDSSDPRALIAWLEGRTEPSGLVAGAVRARGDVTLGPERIAVERLDAEFDRKAIAGRLAYVFATDQRPARLDAALSASQIDLDAVMAFSRGALAGTSLERPGEIALALDFGRASYAGVDARGATANLRFDSSGLVIERLAIADFGGAMLSASGRIDTASSSPHGSIALALEAQRLTGVAALAARFAPDSGNVLKTLSQRAESTKLAAKLDVVPVSSAPDAPTSAKLRLDGAVAGVRVNLAAEARGTLASLRSADVRLDGRLDADDGAALATLVGLDRLAVFDRGPARAALSAAGPANGDLRLDGTFAGAGLDASARGTLRLADAQPRGALDVSFAAADVRLPRRDSETATPVTLAAHVAVDGDHLTLDGLKGKIVGAAVNGHVALGLGDPARIEGHISADTIDAGAILAAAIGAPPARGNTTWSSEPFGPGPLAGVTGHLDLSAARAAIAPGLTVSALRAGLRIEPHALTLERIEGSLAQGHLAAQVESRTDSSGLTTRAHLSVSNADLSTLMPRARSALASGRISFSADVTGTGMSPAALVGALQGGGSLSAERLQFVGLDPNAMTAAAQAADRGVLLDPVRMGDVVRTAVENGRLNIPQIAGALAIVNGRINVGPLTAPAQGTDVAIAGNYALGDGSLDLRFDLTGALAADAPHGQRPQLSIALKGPLESPRRTIEVGPLINWLTLRNVEREAKRLEAAEQEHKRIQAQEEDARRRIQEEARRRAQEEEARRRAQEEEARRQAQEEDARRQAQEQEARRLAQEQEARRRAEDADMPTSGIAAAPALPPPIDIAPDAVDRKPRRVMPTVRLPVAPGPPLGITRPDPR